MMGKETKKDSYYGLIKSSTICLMLPHSPSFTEKVFSASIQIENKCEILDPSCQPFFFKFFFLENEDMFPRWKEN